LATLAAVVGATALPAAAANPTGNVTVKWNIAATGTLALNQNYSAAGAAQTTAPAIVSMAVMPGGASCTAAGAGSEAAGTVNFGAIAPPSGGAANSACQYKNAINAVVTTNDTAGWSITEALSAAMPAGYALCAIPNGFTWGAAAGATMSATSSAAANAVNPTGANACGAGSNGITTTAATAMTNPNAFSAPAANVGEDFELLVPPLATVGANTATVVYTLVLN
jgi:hypothetical protein